MLYSLALAGQPDAGALGQVYDAARANSRRTGWRMLGLALERPKTRAPPRSPRALEQSAQQDAASRPGGPPRATSCSTFSEDVTPEATAYAVKFLSHQRPRSPLLPKAALWLMNHRNEGYWWSSTKQTAMVIYGLTDYLKATNELNPNFTATVYVNDKAALTRKIRPGHRPGRARPGARRKPARRRREPRARDHGGRRTPLLFHARRVLLHRREAAENGQRRRSTSCATTSNLVPREDGDKIVYDTVPLNGPVASGDVIAVRLTVTGSEWRYLMVEDPIPAGTEFIEHDDSYELQSRPPWWEYFFTRRELHDDRMAIFQTYFPQGQQQYFYLLKVVNPGRLPGEPGARAADVSTELPRHYRSRRMEVK